MNETTKTEKPCAAWINETDQCGQPSIAVGYSDFLFLCRDHRGALHVGQQLKHLDEMFERIGVNGDLHEKYPTDGFVYVLYLPNGNAKIGHVRSSERDEKGRSPLVKRWAGLTNELGFKDTPSREGTHPAWFMPLPLAVLDGGESLEVDLHMKWKHLRIPMLGEQFHVTPEFHEWATSLGFSEKAHPHIFGPRVNGQLYSSWAEWCGYQEAQLYKKYGGQERHMEAIRMQQLGVLV